MIFTGVLCKTTNCGNTIALQQVWYAPNEAVWVNPNITSFTILCSHCHEYHEYTKDDVALFRTPGSV